MEWDTVLCETPAVLVLKSSPIRTLLLEHGINAFRYTEMLPDSIELHRRLRSI